MPAIWTSGLHEPSPIEARRVYQFFRVPWSSPRGSLQSRVSSQRKSTNDLYHHSTARKSVTSGISNAVYRAEALADLVHAHYSEQVNLSMLAKLAGVHPSTANKTFRTIFGIPVNEYLTRYRLAQAMQQLAETSSPILQVAYDCGFGSSSRFYDIFKRRTGTTPRLFRSSLERRDDPVARSVR
ncbi:helix-turn-helix transcriptional regulator [Rhizobium sp. P38BS-XIX]|nr:helix-turn-helix transcriptional regulator [Rhizobium sp. P38BS-XIX]